MEWLNENTIAGVGFFGIELELLRIGDSPPAPHFKLVVRPNDWAKKVRPGTASAVTWSWETYARELHVPDERIEVGERLVRAIVSAVEERGLPWQPVMNKGYVAIQRPGGYNALVVDVYYYRIPRLAAKIPSDPESLGLASPFPELQDVWTPAERQWEFIVPPGAQIPDVGALVDLVRAFHPAVR